MSTNRRTVIIGGGTFSHIRTHLSLAAPAFGTTAKAIQNKLYNSELYLTKMASSSSGLVTNEDVSKFVDRLIADPAIGTIVMNVAMCDFEGQIGEVESDKYAERLRTENGDVQLTLTPTEKVISRIRKERPDIFLVGFKTTAGESSMGQFMTALKFMKNVKCNLVLANDVITRNNMIITPEETRYGETTSRYDALTELCDIIRLRQNLTYHRTELIEMPNVPMSETPSAFQIVVRYLKMHGGFIENNRNGFTPGHFCYKIDKDTFLSSQRKMDHTMVFLNGLTKVIRSEDGQTAYGTHKPSVGATSQRLVFDEYPDYDCIVHTHNPKRSESDLPVAYQRPYQCGSLECGQNTVTHMKVYDDDIAAVYLDKHGANILFKSSGDPLKVLDFIKTHLRLGVKES